MIHNKFRYLLTLVALLAVTTGVWAQGYNVTFGGFSESEMNTTVNVASLPQTFTQIGNDEFFPWTVISTSGNMFYGATVTSGGEGKVSVSVPNYEEMSITVSGPFEGTATIHVTGEDDENRDISCDITVSCEAVGGAASGPEVAWNKASKTGTFTMPGGNVELEPEYYPQAALTAQPTAINDVPATTDGAIVKAGTVANITGTETAQGTVMYYVSPTALDDAALLALAADQWTADVPTAADLSEGQAYVYYYVRGNDSDTDEENFSDGDILSANALTVTIAAEPTYAITLAEGTADADKWTIEPTEAKPNTEIKATYSGTKRVKSVKAVKKAEAPSLVIEDKNNYFGIGNQKFYFTEGETWTEAMANHPENAAAGWVIYNDRLRFKPDVYGYAIFILRSGDYYIIEDTILNQPIDTSKTYMFEGTNPT